MGTFGIMMHFVEHPRAEVAQKSAKTPARLAEKHAIFELLRRN